MALNSTKIAFMEEVLGKDGCQTLIKALERYESLESVVVPRTIISWLTAGSQDVYDAEIPGIAGSELSFVKTESGYSGTIGLSESIYSFDNADVYHLASGIGLALGVDDDNINPKLRDLDLVKLGKSIDLLAKTQKIKKSKKKLKKDYDAWQMEGSGGPVFAPNINKLEAPGPQAPHIPQKEPEGPIANPVVQPKVRKKRSLPALNVTKSESEKECKVCRQKQFLGDRFIGCECLADLSKSVSTIVTKHGFIIKFKGLDEDAVLSVVEALKYG